MNRAELVSFYQERKNAFTSQRGNVAREVNAVSNARLGVALLFILFFYFGITHQYLLYTLPLLIVAFVLLVRKHTELFNQRSHLDNLVRVNETEINKLNGDLSGLATGAEFTDPHHPYSHDLDLFGEGSLYQHINRCNTLDGKDRLAHRLSYPLTSKIEIEASQAAVQELAAKTGFRQHFQAGGGEMKELKTDRTQLLDWIKQPSFIYGRPLYSMLLVCVPVLTIGSILGAFFFPVFKSVAILLAGFQWTFLGFHLKKVRLFHDYISRKKNILEKYSKLLLYLEDEKFSSPVMNALAQQAQDAGKRILSLASLVKALDARLNSMTMLVTNSLFMYDLRYVYRLEKWKEENAQKLAIWLHAISETEVLSSFATFAFNNPSFTYAEIIPELYVKATELGHPLLPEAECVTNDLQLGKDQQVFIVTGANMAGKSTFLRSIGINLILALNGAPVFAKQFSCPVVTLRTGMRTADSLREHQSYFYAELDRLKGIMDDLRRNIPLLILLDEILKGTNSADKQAGSIALVRQLLPHPCLAIIATHDLALGTLEQEFPGKIRNYHFEAAIENDQLSFDYKLKEGIAQTMNATFLMKKMGIIPR